MYSFLKYKSFLEHYIKKDYIGVLLQNWNNSNRKYHTFNHLDNVIKYIEKNKIIYSEIEYSTLILTAFFHDAIYDPKNSINHENDSIRFFKEAYNHDNQIIKNKVIEIIECTKYREKPSDKLCELFWEADNEGFTKGFSYLLENEKMLRSEFLFIPKKIYKEKRINFLKSNMGLFSKKVDKDLKKLIKWVENKY